MSRYAGINLGIILDNRANAPPGSVTFTNATVEADLARAGGPHPGALGLEAQRHLVGGPVPLGYAAIDKKVIVVPAEAETVGTAAHSLTLDNGGTET